LKQVTLGKRLVTPSKIICVGRNYHAHIKEMHSELPDQIVFFCKPNSAISNHLVSFEKELLHFEGELSFIYENGRFSAVGFGFDLTKRHLQKQLKQKGLPWERAKAFDDSAVFSEFVEIEDDTQYLRFELRKNNTLVQHADTDLMIHKPAEILTEIQTFMTLNDGDIVMTGTPSGVGAVENGDVFAVELKNQNTTLIDANWQAKQ